MNTSHPAIIKLRQLKPNEVFVYHRGDLEQDIKRSMPFGNDRGTPNYLRVLEQLRAVVVALSQQGKISLNRREIYKGGKLSHYEHVAIGR